MKDSLGARLRLAGAKGALVERVNHPFLFRNPDLLYAETGQLTAVFAPTSEERRTPDKLLARLIVSRMALQAETMFVLSLKDDDADSLPLGAIEPHFDAVIASQNIADWKSVVRAAAPKPGPILEKTRVGWWRAFRRRQVFAETTIRHAVGDVGTRWVREALDDMHSLKVESWTGGLRHRTTTLRTTKSDGRIAIVEPAGFRSARHARAACLTALRSAYVIDTGLPYKRGDSPTVMAPVAIVSFPRLDPLWDARVLAFSGAVPVPADLNAAQWNALEDGAMQRGHLL